MIVEMRIGYKSIIYHFAQERHLFFPNALKMPLDIAGKTRNVCLVSKGQRPTPRKMEMKAHQIQNDNSKFGQRASKPVMFGECKRFCAFACHTRFDRVEWFVQDAEILDEYGLPSIVSQASSFEDATRGFGYCFAPNIH